MVKKVLISGSSGFVGFHISKLLLDSNYQVTGIDSMNNYYDTKLKKLRLKKLQGFKRFNFHKNDLSNFNSVSQIFKKEKPDIVIHLAAQAGVRFSKINPKSYVDSNLTAFSNIIENVRYSKIKLIYASSSSVYGKQKKFPLTEDIQLNPQSFYGLTKKFNEDIADFYSKEFNLGIIGLRFFTVYGPFGRPDMAYFKFSKNISNDLPITVYNNALMSRDMTYIDDICDGILKSTDFECLDHQVFNLGNNKPIKLARMISFIENYFGKKAILKFENSEDEVQKTLADLTKSREILKYEPETLFEDGMTNFLSWYSTYKDK